MNEILGLNSLLDYVHQNDIKMLKVTTFRENGNAQ